MLRNIVPQHLNSALETTISWPYRESTEAKSKALEYIIKRKKDEQGGKLILTFTELEQAFLSDIENDTYNIFKCLVKETDNIDVTNARGDNILHRIIHHLRLLENNKENTPKKVLIIKLSISQLLDKGIDASTTGGQNMTPLYIATLCNQPDIIKSIAEKADINQLFYYNGAKTSTTALFQASLNGNINSMTTILGIKGINIDLQNSDGMTALHAAASSEIIAAQTLLAHGANPNIHSQSGSTPLHMAVLDRNVEMTALLLNMMLARTYIARLVPLCIIW